MTRELEPDNAGAGKMKNSFAWAGSNVRDSLNSQLKTIN
jgi:hypothetical protein